ncbi:extracellular solute-binding protein [Comamonas sp. JUb58]|uniref:ABC transporter substrate-binding protein n=1 Tax=Comamonas sp. JUb58 TaxID=2485114 RepID=UPI00105FD73B|nr:extracellular solute-binding protein [Comamonas sp. JUb58]TDS70421.1 carbohydrate ABC transporter substrate-binding protein (CUT1 family) [Comamonas sp. JUb58]
MKFVFRTLLSSMLIAAASGVYAQEAVTLTVTAWKGGTAEPAAFPGLIAKFEKENPSIKVKLEHVSRNDTTTLVSSRLQSGAGPDVMMVDRPLLRQWGGAGQLMDLSSEPASSQLAADVKPLAELDGKVLMQPMELVGVGMLVNMDLLNKAGITKAPANVAELKASCQKLNALGVRPLLLPAKDGWGPMVFALSMGMAPALRESVNFVNDVVAKKKSFAGNPYFTKAVGTVKELADAGCYDAKLNVGVDVWNLGLSEFGASRVAMMPQGAWSIQKFTKLKDFNFQFVPIPALDGQKPGGMDMLGTAWAINRATKQGDAAKKWLAFWAKDENLGKFLEQEAAFTPFTKGTDWAPRQADVYAQARKAGETVPYPKGVLSAAFFQEAQKSMTSYLLDLNQKPEALLQRWDAAPN